MGIEIRGGFSEEFGAVLEAPETLIAFATKEGANVAFLVAVIYREFQKPSPNDLRFGLIANRAQTLLSSVLVVIPFDRYAVASSEKLALPISWVGSAKFPLIIALIFFVLEFYLGGNARLSPVEIVGAPRFVWLRATDRYTPLRSRWHILNKRPEIVFPPNGD